MNGNGERPRASAATLINMCILAIMLVSGGVAIMLYLGAIRTDVVVLQNQMVDLKAWTVDISRKVDSLVGSGKRVN